jgi:hypothetical protein
LRQQLSSQLSSEVSSAHGLQQRHSHRFLAAEHLQAGEWLTGLPDFNGTELPPPNDHIMRWYVEIRRRKQRPRRRFRQWRTIFCHRLEPFG